MNSKCLLLGYAAALIAASGARAADAVVVAEPEPVASDRCWAQCSPHLISVKTCSVRSE